MKLHLYLNLLLFILSGSYIEAQTKADAFLCGHDFVLNINEKTYPGYKEKVSIAFNEASHTMKNMHAQRNDILTIPVVVHIVWKNEVENLHDSIIESQLKVLNKAYRLQNEDKENIRTIFKDLQEDAGIEFKLAEVKRVKTSASFALSLNGLPDKVKQSGQGGSNALDPDRYLNIWVCKIQPIPFIGGQILGYAYPPAGLSNWPEGSEAPSKDLEGLVIDYRVFGANNPNILTVNGQMHDAVGRTTVHEVGHYLGLRHIWGDGGGIFGGDSCAEDDGISDTPNQGAQTAGGCDKTLNTCIDPEGNDLPDMIENYMDYSGERCQNTFTKEQVGLMRSVLMTQRQLLLSDTDQYSIKTPLKVYPNPVDTWLNISLDNIDQIEHIELFSQSGHFIRTIGKHPTKQIDFTDLAEGIYFIRVYFPNEVRVIKVAKVNKN